MADADSFASSDDSSDDEFLTIKAGGGRQQDREALIRKKLMENFYGKTVNSKDEDDPDEGEGHVDHGEDDDQEEEDMDEEEGDEDIHGASDDLDSPYFDPEAHTSNHVYQSDIHTLLEVEESLALEVRTLDSTMQTLVYENYSKFIDATDAIRSIGVSVHANEQGLEKLTRGVVTIHDTSREVEEALGGLRDAVAEKLRVKRLLKRLDALLKLPATLQQQKRDSQYRMAVKSYLAAHAILTKHSEGFESLKSIEMESHTIMADMVKTMHHKMMHWSGNLAGVFPSSFSLPDDMNDTEKDEDQPAEDDAKDELEPPESPETISEIFECAGTLATVLPKQKSAYHDKEDETELPQDKTTFDAGVSPTECKNMALEATIRYLERVLDTHQIELQDAMFGTADFDEDGFETPNTQPTQKAETGSNLIPTVYLEKMLEAVTLFGVSFSVDGAPSISDSDRLMLVDFVSEAYDGFLAHVKTVLLEQSTRTTTGEDDDGFARTEEENEEILEDMDDSDAAYSEVSGAMVHLLRVVGELASGLALPNVGVDPEFASSLVEQAVDVTETMVRRRVAQKFLALRLRVVQESLAPFVREASKFEVDDAEDDTPRVMQIVQVASIALSDGLQLVDDTVSSILTGGVVVSDLKGVDFVMVKLAVQGCCRRFVMWLASTLEVLAGLESSSPKFTVEAEEEQEEEGDPADKEEEFAIVSDEKKDDLSEMSNQQDIVGEKVEKCLGELLTELDDAPDKARMDFLLAITEMCRLAHRSVMENINQSIHSSRPGSGRKLHKNTDIFQSSASMQKSSLNEKDQTAADRFMLSASRVLSVYIMNRGSDAALLFCRGLLGVSELEGEGLPSGPRDESWQVLEIAKMASLDCTTIFGGERCAGPVPGPPMDEDKRDIFNTGGGSAVKSQSSFGGMAVKGLQMDVEKMFTEKFPTYPHPSHTAEFTRSAVVTGVLQVTFNAILEKARCCTFTAAGYRQLQVDVAILRHFLPHYVKDDFLKEGNNLRTVLDNLLNDVMTSAGERCKDLDCVGQTRFYDPVTDTTTTLQSFVRAFLAIDDGEENIFGEGDDEDHKITSRKKIMPRIIIEEVDQEDK